MLTSIVAPLALVGILAVLGYSILQWYVRRRKANELAACRQTFMRRREWLEARFLQTAGGRGTPRGLEWVDCDFGNDVAFARDRQNGELTALVSVGIQFRAIEGGGMEDVEAVAQQKSATAVFRCRDHEWTTDGRAIFNLNPLEAIQYYVNELEPVE